MLNLRVRFSTRVFYWLPVAFFLGASMAEAVPAQNVILGQYVVDPSKLSKSLLFDQIFDREVVRPLQRQLVDVGPAKSPASAFVAQVEVVKAEPATARGSLVLAGIETPKKYTNIKIPDETFF
jgi:hypothetical protein